MGWLVGFWFGFLPIDQPIAAMQFAASNAMRLAGQCGSNDAMPMKRIFSPFGAFSTVLYGLHSMHGVLRFDAILMGLTLICKKTTLADPFDTPSPR